jgi:hypothetical protein
MEGMKSEIVDWAREQLIGYDTSVLVVLWQKHWREVYRHDLGEECGECIDAIGWAWASWAAEKPFTKESALGAIDYALRVLARVGVEDVGRLEEIRQSVDQGEPCLPGSA